MSQFNIKNPKKKKKSHFHKTKKKYKKKTQKKKKNLYNNIWGHYMSPFSSFSVDSFAYYVLNKKG